MLLLLSPAKTLQTAPPVALKTSTIRFKKETAELVEVLSQLSLADLKKLMKLSDSLAALNYGRYQHFNPKSYTQKNAEPAGLAFHGAVFQGLGLDTFSDEELAFAQDHPLRLNFIFADSHIQFMYMVAPLEEEEEEEY